MKEWKQPCEVTEIIIHVPGLTISNIRSWEGFAYLLIFGLMVRDYIVVLVSLKINSMIF